MLVKDMQETDFVNYKKPSMFIIFPTCTFKCDRENNCQYCQNWELVKQPNIEISIKTIVEKYIKNDLTESVVLGGLEPLDSFDDVKSLLSTLRTYTKDDIVIYTGYREEEVEDKTNWLKQYENVIIKFGRYKPNEQKHYDEILGVYLANNEQYARKIS